MATYLKQQPVPAHAQVAEQQVVGAGRGHERAQHAARHRRRHALGRLHAVRAAAARYRGYVL